MTGFLTMRLIYDFGKIKPCTSRPCNRHNPPSFQDWSICIEDIAVVKSCGKPTPFKFKAKTVTVILDV